MEDALLEILEATGYPVYRQGSMSEDDTYPETFVTFWNNESADHSHYDNTEYGIFWNFDVNVYSSDPELTYSVLSDIRTALKGAGWIVSGKGYDVASDEATHTGRGLTALIVEFEKEED